MIDSDKPPEDIRPGETCEECTTDISVDNNGQSVIDVQDNQIVRVQRYCRECGTRWTVWQRE